MDKRFPSKGGWASLPTPIHKLPKLSEELGIELWIKRDDLTGFEWTGNKIRKLDFLVQDAVQKKADCLITCGGLQSNHCRATAALAARLGLRCVLLLRGEEPKEYSSNFLLHRLFGAEILFLDEKSYYEEMGDLRIHLESQIRLQGGSPYFIPEGGSNALGCLGYANAFDELNQQLDEIPVTEMSGVFDSIFVANGSGGTQAGLVLGKLLAIQQLGNAYKRDWSETKILGVNVCYGERESFGRVKTALWETIQRFQFPLSFFPEDIEILSGFLGGGYGVSSKEELAFLAKVARMEGILLDPVYTGKALFGLYSTVKKRPGFGGKKILFFHTGGGFGIFRGQLDWSEALR